MTEIAIIIAALPVGVFVGVAVESARRARAVRVRYSTRVRKEHRWQS